MATFTQPYMARKRLSMRRRLGLFTLHLPFTHPLYLLRFGRMLRFVTAVFPLLLRTMCCGLVGEVALAKRCFCVGGQVCIRGGTAFANAPKQSTWSLRR